MNGYSTGTGQTQSFSEIAFAFRITPEIVLIGMVFAMRDGDRGRPASRLAGGASADHHGPARGLRAGRRTQSFETLRPVRAS